MSVWIRASAARRARGVSGQGAAAAAQGDGDDTAMSSAIRPAGMMWVAALIEVRQGFWRYDMVPDCELLDPQDYFSKQVAGGESLMRRARIGQREFRIYGDLRRH